MSQQEIIVQRHRNVTAVVAAYTGPEGEVVVDTEKKVEVVQDGVTAGGFPQARQYLFNILEFGAQAVPGFDNTIAIQNAINACKLFGGGEVKIPGPNFEIGSGLTLYSAVKLSGVTNPTFLPGDNPDPGLIGSCLTWTGGSSGTMITLTDTQGAIIEGIGLFGNLDSVPGTTLVGVSIASGGGFYNSQRNYIRNSCIANCNIGVGFSLASADQGNVDGWEIKDCLIYNTNTGIKTNSANVFYAKITGTAIQARDAGIDLTRCGGITIDQCSGSKYGANDNGTFLKIGATSGNVVILGGEAENADPTKFSFARLEGTKTTPTLFISPEVNARLLVLGTHTNLTFVSPHFNYEMRVSGNNNYITLIRPLYESGHGTIDTGTGNVFDDDSNDTGVIEWTPQVYQGTTLITGLTTVEATLQRKGNIGFLNCSVFKESGAPSASGDWKIAGIPFSNGATGPFILPAGDISINGVDYHVLTPYYWKVNIDEGIATLIGAQKSTSWTTDFIIFQFTGWFFINP